QDETDVHQKAFAVRRIDELPPTKRINRQITDQPDNAARNADADAVRQKYQAQNISLDRRYQNDVRQMSAAREYLKIAAEHIKRVAVHQDMQQKCVQNESRKEAPIFVRADDERLVKTRPRDRSFGPGVKLRRKTRRDARDDQKRHIRQRRTRLRILFFDVVRFADRRLFVIFYF